MELKSEHPSALAIRGIRYDVDPLNCPLVLTISAAITAVADAQHRLQFGVERHARSLTK